MPTAEKRTPTSNNSQTNRAKMLSGRELSLFKKNNPYLPQGGRYNFPQSSLLSKTIGDIFNCCDVTQTPVPDPPSSVPDPPPSAPPSQPATVPDPPTSVSASYGDTQSIISFTAPVNNGGSAIISYTVTSSPEGIIATGSSSPITITGLTNGVSYTYTVVATNINGDSTPSSPSSAITAGDDAIIDSLSTSLAVYQSAADDDWIKITSGEYATLQTNISGTVKAGMTDDYLTTSTSSGLANSGSAVVANSVTTKSPAIPANSYLYAFAVRWVTAIPTENMCVFTNTNTATGSGFNKIGSVLPATTEAGLSYYVRKGISATNGSTAGLLACFTGTKLDYPNPSFTGSAGYISFKYLTGTSPIPNMRYLIGGNSIPGNNTTLTGNLGGYGAFAIQGLTTNTKQWI